MKTQKKLGRKLTLNKLTIACLEQKSVLAGKPPVPCNRTVPTEVICTLYDCYTIHVGATCPASCPVTCTQELSICLICD